MITVLTWLWGTRRGYQPRHVQQLARSVAAHLAVPHRFVCVTDAHVPGVRVVPTPSAAKGFPERCYRRLWMFSPEATALGEALLHLDLDVVVCGDLAPFVTHGQALKVYKAGSIARRGYSFNPSVLFLRTGSQADIWARFTEAPGRLMREAQADGWWGSDQAILSYLRRAVDVPTFGDADGLVSYRRLRHEHLTIPPPDTRLVSFHGKKAPWDADVLAAHPWIRQAWQEAA